MPQIGGKPKVSKTPKKKKSSSSTTNRNFTVVIGSKEHGLYVSSSPSSAARKAVSKLCATDKKKKVEFCIREITQNSEKKTYGPYVGYIEKLAKPIELKWRVILYKPHLKKIREKTNIKGGFHPSCDNYLYNYNNLLTNLGVNDETKTKYQTQEKKLLCYSNPKKYKETLHDPLQKDNSLTKLQKNAIKRIISDDYPNNKLIKLKKQCKKYRNRQESLIEPLYGNDKKIYGYHFKNNNNRLPSLERWFNKNQMNQIHKQHIKDDILSKKLNQLREEIKQQKLSKNIRDNERKRRTIKEERSSILSKISTKLRNGRNTVRRVFQDSQLSHAVHQLKTRLKNKID